ncbi:type VI secretion system baseplate subunit TssK [Marinobacterium arenosum]|uniref:type VI secretion system baseplate subunit TssK n=1 Tax=Marinobacterium arenosum TaxID=2862496 RepID=UPI0028F43CA7|nr:type VI secretion system baseplate subunit TssK [Marinobacterium arenosum]
MENFLKGNPVRRHRKVVWSEGMFIAPQHFQQQDRHVHHYVEQYVAAAGHGKRYGLSELQIDRERLKIGKIAVTGCRGIFPDGTFFECDRELMLEVPETTLEKKIYLALPMAVEGEVEYGEQGENRRYVQDQVTLFDTSEAGNNGVETRVAQANVRLLIEGDDITGLTVMPFARVLERRESGALVLDQGFIPACIQYGASSQITERLKELQVLIETRANMVVQRIEAGQERKSEQTLLREYLWLQTLNRWVPWFSATLENPAIPTDEVYLQLATLSAELCSFVPAVAQSAAPLHSHEMHAAFNPLFSRLRDQLSLVQSDSVLEYVWDDQLFEKRRLLRAAVPDIYAMDNHRFVLCVESSIGASALAQLFPSACKLCGLSQIAELVRNSLSGVTLKALPVAPTELKPRADVAYIEIDTHHPYWLELVEKREPLALHVDGRIPDLNVKLYALG